MLLTARSGTESLVAGLRAGADEFLSKPIDPDQLMGMMRGWLYR
jgi:DNA-binding response OmpR family regulator